MVCKKDGDRHLVELIVIGQGVNLRKAFFMVSTVNQGHRLPREVVDALFLETCKVRWDGTLIPYCRAVGLDGLEISFPVETIL